MKFTIGRELIQSCLAGTGTMWLFTDIYCAFLKNGQNEPPISLGLFILFSLGLGIAWFFINGYWISGFLLNSIHIKINGIKADIHIFYGDLFKQKDWKAIAVNEYFDSAADEKHVATRSLHGKMLGIWGANVSDWNRQIAESLKDTNPIEIVTRPEAARCNRYEIGTTVIAKEPESNQKFLCVALSKTDIKTLQASADLDMLNKALRGLLKKAREVCANSTLNVPLMGDQLSRTGIKPSSLLDLILLAILEESKKQEITGRINIVLHNSVKNKINLAAIKKTWE